MERKEPLFIQCSCYGEGLVVECEDYGDDLGPEVEIAFYSKGMGDPRCLRARDKIRFAWRIFTKGRPYNDMVCLKLSEVEKLRDYLSDILAKE